MGFQPVDAGTVGMNPEEALIHPLLQVDADRAQVPYDLIRRLLEGEVDAWLSAATGGVNEVCRDRSLTSSGSPGNQDAGSAVDPFPTQHLVQGRDPGGHPFHARRVPESD